MLKHLHIQNYALISRLDIDFGEGFSVMTGETGAGKSIILGALALVLGARADSKAITDGEDKCIIEATFNVQRDDVRCTKEVIIRRELYRNGKSRSFVDDSVVSLAELKTLSTQLIDIHSQHANLMIENAAFQLEVVDAVAKNKQILSHYSEQYNHWQETRQTYEHLKALAQKSRDDQDYTAYRHQLLDEAGLEDKDELETLEQEHYRLSHAEEILSALRTAAEALNGEQHSAIDALRSCRIETIAPELQERIESARIELQDIAEEAGRMANRIEINPERLQWVEERIVQIRGLLHKFNMERIEDLITLRDELAEQLQKTGSLDFETAQAEKAMNEARTELSRRAEALTKSRKGAVEEICRKLTDGLNRLAVPHAKIDIDIRPSEDFTPTGRDEVEILFAANLNQSLRAVSEVASGGEISRLMLCIKALIAGTMGLPTIIFDEIDTGVSGAIATRMAAIMLEMARNRQIIAITHLPQIAAMGENHYKVYKADTDTRTETNIRRLTDEERVTEIAAMLSGKEISESALKTAQELLSKRDNI